MRKWIIGLCFVEILLTSSCFHIHTVTDTQKGAWSEFVHPQDSTRTKVGGFMEKQKLLVKELRLICPPIKRPV